MMALSVFRTFPLSIDFRNGESKDKEAASKSKQHNGEKISRLSVGNHRYSKASSATAKKLIVKKTTRAKVRISDFPSQ